MKKKKEPKKRGRPTDYRPEYCQMLIDYFSEPSIEKAKIVTQGRSYLRTEDKILFRGFPTFERFAHKIGVNGDTLVEWSKKYPEFSAAYTRAKELQKKHLYEGGLSGIYNSNVVALIASHEHKIHLRQEIEDKTPLAGTGRIFSDLELAARVSYLIEKAIRLKKERDALEAKEIKKIPEKVGDAGLE
jgi:hypothetical protein